MSSAIQQILVHLDASAKRSSARLHIARQLAHQHGAALAALYAVAPSFVALPYPPQGGLGLGINMPAIDEERRALAKAAFDEAMKKSGAPASWGALGEGTYREAFARQALYADLVVLGQHDPSDKEPAGVAADFAESVLAASGKAALIVPWTGVQRDVGDTVVVAWKETPESARAVAAAMPLLQRARRVHVVTWSPAEAGTGGTGLSLDTYLRAHQVQPVWHRYGDEPSHLGELLLSSTFDLEADLLVMGCYGHSRAREWVLGGISRTVLQSMTLPVLMAH